jgi:hypothetical protein
MEGLSADAALHIWRWAADPGCTQVLYPATTCLRRDDTDDVGDIVIEFTADGQHPGTVFRAGDDTVATEFAAGDFDLSFEEPDPRITSSSDGFDKEVHGDIEPAQHGDRTPSTSLAMLFSKTTRSPAPENRSCTRADQPARGRT